MIDEKKRENGFFPNAYLLTLICGKIELIKS